jgi:hypothetical protein
LSCGHKFHFQCLALNVKADNKECPLCRSALEASLSQVLSSFKSNTQQQQQQQQQPPQSFTYTPTIPSLNLPYPVPTYPPTAPSYLPNLLPTYINVSNCMHSSLRIYFTEKQTESEFFVIKKLEILKKTLLIDNYFIKLT